MNNLAFVLNRQGKRSEAEEIYQRTLELSERVLGKEHLSTLTSMNNLAFVLNNQGKYGKAEKIYQQTLELRERVLGKEHPDTLTSMSDLASVLDSQGKYSKAEEMYRRTLEVRKRVLGKEHPDTLKSMSNLAGVLGRQGKYECSPSSSSSVVKTSEKARQTCRGKLYFFNYITKSTSWIHRPRKLATCSSHNAFPYQPLAVGQIRLLSISGEEGNLIYTLSHNDLDSKRKYSTLSYTWDDQERKEDLFVNDLVLKVIRNVKTLLPYLARIEEYQHFWIDGICINQDDDKEKEVQIPLMQKIYTQATKCFVWIGEGNFNTDQAIPIIPTIVEKLQDYDPRTGLNDRYLAAHGLPTLSYPVWAGLYDIFSKNWFTRVWTFQEAVLPDVVEIICGRFCINFDNIAAVAVKLLQASASISMDTMADPVRDEEILAQAAMGRVRAIQEARKQRHLGASTEYTFLTLLQSSREWLSSNPVDKIYGLLGLADPSIQKRLKINLKKKLDVYLAFAISWINQDTHLVILHLASSSGRSLLELPTWCPNFSHLPVENPLGLCAVRAKYCAGVKVEEISREDVPPDSRAVEVKGFCVDEISEALPCPWEKQRHITAELRSAGVAKSMMWGRKCLELSQLAYRTSGEVPDAHWRTLIANKHANGHFFTGPGRELYHLMKIRMPFLTTANTWLSDEELLLARQPMTNSQLLMGQEFMESMGYSAHGRSFFSTKGGRVGLGPPHTKPGDLVCIFYNSYTPFIIGPRKEAPTHTSNEFIGEAYVDGLMYGEALEIEDRNPDEFFTLE
jgi:tetratricopeptide (TPR) repeat protein